jgi:hypothetical protein
MSVILYILEIFFGSILLAVIVASVVESSNGSGDFLSFTLGTVCFISSMLSYLIKNKTSIELTNVFHLKNIFL